MLHMLQTYCPDGGVDLCNTLALQAIINQVLPAPHSRLFVRASRAAASVKPWVGSEYSELTQLLNLELTELLAPWYR